MDVLVLDDNELNVKALSRVLRSRHTVRVAMSSAEAMAQVEVRRPDVVLCDFELGEETSVNFLRAMTAQHPGMRRILYSASRPELWRELVREQLIDLALSKPVSIEELLASISPQPSR
jgi:DNA-binding NtrC family response regulator